MQVPVEIVPMVDSIAMPSTAQFTSLLLTPASSTCNCNVCDVVTTRKRRRNDKWSRESS